MSLRTDLLSLTDRFRNQHLCLWPMLTAENGFVALLPVLMSMPCLTHSFTVIPCQFCNQNLCLLPLFTAVPSFTVSHAYLCVTDLFLVSVPVHICLQAIETFMSLGIPLVSVEMNYTAPADAIYNIIISKSFFSLHCLLFTALCCLLLHLTAFEVHGSPAGSLSVVKKGK